MPHDLAGQMALNGADALGVEHDLGAQHFRQLDDSEIVIKAPAAGDILQEAAAAAYEKVCLFQSLADGRHVQPGNGLYAVTLRGILGGSRNDGDMKFGFQVT